MKATTCAACREVLSDSLASQAAATAVAAAQEHLATCSECQALARDLVWQDLAIAELAGREQTAEVLSRLRASIATRRRVGWMAAAAVAAVVLAAWILFPPSSAPERETAKEKIPVPREVPAPPLPPPLPPEPPAVPPIVPAPPPPVPPTPAPAPTPVVPPPAAAPTPTPLPEPPPPPRTETLAAVARLLKLSGEVLVAGGEPAREGQDLLEGRGLEMRAGGGRSVVEFPDGTRLELRRGTSISSLGAAAGKRVVVAKGTVFARVAPQPKGAPLIFAAPHAEVAVLGTSLRVAVEPAGTRVDVEEGQVSVKRPSDLRPLLLSAGQTAFAAEGKPLAARKLQPALDERASRLAPGTWAEFETEGFEPAELQVKPWLHALADAEEAKWDPVERRLHLLGYTTQDECSHLVYDVRSNAWQKLRSPPGESWFGPAYDHVALDPVARALYFRQHNHDLVHQLDLRTDAWSALPRMPANPGEIGALENFPELGGLVFVGGGSVYLYRVRSKRWEVLARALEFGTGDAFAEYDPLRKVLYFGGGTGRRTLFLLDATGAVTALRDAPIPLGLKDALLFAEPAGGRLLVLSRPDGKSYYEYDLAQNRWTALDAPPLPVMRAAPRAYTTAAPLPGLGVVMLLVADETSADVYLYRHGAARK